MADLSAVLFGSTPSPGPRREERADADADAIIEKIRAEARRQGLTDPDLAVAVAIKESGLKPWAWGDRGASLGLFQLQRKAAIDAGIDPDRRQEVDLNIVGGVRYLKQKLAQSEGNVAEALRRYNSGTPDFRGLGDPRYVDRALAIRRDLEKPAAFAKYGAVASSPLTNAATRGYRTVRAAFSPAGAEAAPVSPARQTGGRGQQLSDDLFGPLEAASGAPPAAGTLAAPFTGASPTPAAVGGRGGQVSEELFGPPPAVPGPRSPALAAEQQQAAQRPWWQRAAQAVGAASPEIALLAPELPQIEQARAEMSPAEREELRRMEGQAGTGANVGELVGQTLGSAVMPGFGTAIGGTIGAVTGKTAETLLQEGRLPTWKEIGTEAAWSALPEAAESLGRLGLRTIARGTRGGQIIRFDEAARRARALPEVFEAQTREQVGDAFEAVRQSGVQLDTSALRQEIQGLRPGKYADVMAELRRLDREMKTGNRYQQLVQNLRQTGGVQVTGLPIGDLQQLRSGLRSRIDQLEHTEARQLLRDVQRAVDDAVDQGIARGRTAAGQTPEQLQQARREWGRVRASEDMGDLIERTITTTPDLSMASFNMRQFADAMRRNTGDLAQSVNRSLDQVPGARARFLREMDDIAQLYQTAELPMADVFGIWRMPGFAMVRQWISQALMSDTGRQLFREAMIAGRGRMSLNGLAAAVNAGRRELGLDPLDLFGQNEASTAPSNTPPPPAAGR